MRTNGINKTNTIVTIASCISREIQYTWTFLTSIGSIRLSFEQSDNFFNRKSVSSAICNFNLFLLNHRKKLRCSSFEFAPTLHLFRWKLRKHCFSAMFLIPYSILFIWSFFFENGAASRHDKHFNWPIILSRARWKIQRFCRL